MMHAAMLRAASWMTPCEVRAEWLAEWTAELAFVRRESPRRATLFCLGAFRDALWVRRNTPSAPARGVLLGSPARCLVVLGAIAAICVCVAWRLPGTRLTFAPLASAHTGRLVIIERASGKLNAGRYLWLEQHLPREFSPGLISDHGLVLARYNTAPPAPQWHISIPEEGGRILKFRCTALDLRQPFLVLLLLAGMALPIVVGTTSLSLGEYPPLRSTRARPWAFFAAKLALIVAIVFFGILDLGSGTTVEVRPHGILAGFVVGFRWALQDQRRRCPVCLRRLTNPVRFGQAAHALLDWYGTELICSAGHGMMHVPEIPTSSYPVPRWVSLEG
ncbi:MAG TPA: hypothetical protein VKE70_21950 [Candidatus Solibacter sp.]|nr:hypothetical protein [Candidatus Solibacter sp.]